MAGSVTQVARQVFRTVLDFAILHAPGNGGEIDSG